MSGNNGKGMSRASSCNSRGLGVRVLTFSKNPLELPTPEFSICALVATIDENDMGMPADDVVVSKSATMGDFP